MRTRIIKGIICFGIFSLIIGVIQIALGVTNGYSIWTGIINSFLFFTIGFMMIGLANIIDILLDIKGAVEDLIYKRKND